MATTKPDYSKHPNGVIEVTLDKVRKLKWTNNTRCELESALDINLFEQPNPFAVGVRAFREALYQMLRRDDPRITREACGDFFDEYDNDGALTLAIVRAWRVGEGLTADPTPDEQQKADEALQEAASPNA